VLPMRSTHAARLAMSTRRAVTVMSVALVQRPQSPAGSSPSPSCPLVLCTIRCIRVDRLCNPAARRPSKAA
jgi:hypothetical protein